MKFIICLLVIIYTSTSFGATYSKTSLIGAQGSGYKEAKEKRDYLALSQYTAYDYGDILFYVKSYHPTEEQVSPFTEVLPRFSMDKVFGIIPENKFIKDVSLAFEYEAVKGVQAYMAGLSLDLKIPYFSFFMVNLFRRDVSTIDDTSFELLVLWGLPFDIMSSKFLFDTVIYWFSDEGSVRANFIGEFQLFYDVGNLWNNPGHFYLGPDLFITRNKLGQKGVHEEVYMASFKYVF